jgi:hypothetical protein
VKTTSLLALSLAASFAIAPHAHAVGTRLFELDTTEDFTTPDSKGVAVTSDGRVHEGLTLGALALGDGVVTLASLTDARGRVLVGTAPQGKLLRIDGAIVTPLAETKELAIASMVRAGDDVFLGTVPNGRIFRLRGDTLELFATLEGADHVWALSYDAMTKTLVAGTGPDGKIFKIDDKGKASLLADLDEPHVTALARSDAGRLVAGTAGQHAWVMELAADGKTSFVAELPGKEVKALQFATGGDLFAIANEYGELPDVPKRPAAADRAPAGPASYPRPKAGKGALLRVDTEGRVEKLLGHADTHYTALHVQSASKVFVGTGNDGRVFAVDDAHRSELLADVEERAIVQVDPTPGRGFVVTSDASFLRRIQAPGEGDGVWTSKVLDASQRAHLGAFSTEAKGTVELAFRTGPTATPDARWSDWSSWAAKRSVPSVPTNRYVQVRARGFAKGAELSLVRIPFVPENQRALLTEVTVAPRGAPTRAKDGLIVLATDAPKHDAIIKLSWRVENPDADALRYRVAFRKESDTIWRELFDEDTAFTKTETEWDTSSLVEGRYVVRVEASDELANAPGKARKHLLETDAFAVDNAPPRFLLASVEGDKLHARVVDGLGPVARLEVAVDGKTKWTSLDPVDGVFDDADETFAVDLPRLAAPGVRHVLTLRAFDRAGNSAVVETPWNP